jgi:hypothetical protein
MVCRVDIDGEFVTHPVGLCNQASPCGGFSRNQRDARKLICFSIDVDNRDYHYLSHSEIDGGKRISQRLSQPACARQSPTFGELAFA